MVLLQQRSNVCGLKEDLNNVTCMKLLLFLLSIVLSFITGVSSILVFLSYISYSTYSITRNCFQDHQFQHCHYRIVL